MNRRSTDPLFWSVVLIGGGGIFLPIALGLMETLLPAFGRLPAIGASDFNLSGWRRLLELPGFHTSLWLTVTTGFTATLIALFLSVGVFAAAGDRGANARLRKLINPLLASPHAAVAIALAFLIAPSGWLFRALSPWATGSSQPPDVAIVHDPAGLSLILGLVIKEVPFMVFMFSAALRQIPVATYVAVGRSLGYSRPASWLLVIFPQLYRHIRLPLYAVLAFSLTAMDAAIILGPNNPPTLAVQTLRWFSHPDVDMILPASASAILQAIIVLTGITAWWLSERAVIWLGTQWIERGPRERWSARIALLLSRATYILVLSGIVALAGLVIWSFSWRWSFPNVLPESWTIENWLRASPGWVAALKTTFVIAAGSTFAALLLAIAWLEAEDRSGKPHLRLLSFFIYAPLILPQAAFIFGLHITLLRTGFDTSLNAVMWTHTLFVFPYVMIALAEPWRALDKRYVRTASTLGHAPMTTLVRVKLPILLGPLLAATAIGFAVSVAQYLPTLVIGAGRIETLTTEAVARASGGDRRIIAIYAGLQALLPLIAYLLAYALPTVLYSNRKGLSGDRA